VINSIAATTTYSNYFDNGRLFFWQIEMYHNGWFWFAAKKLQIFSN
jgi:hypothetical protein